MIRFEAGTLIRNIKTKRPMLVIGYVCESILVADPQDPEAVAQLDVILKRDIDNWLSDVDYKTEEKRSIEKQDYEINFVPEKISSVRI